MSLIEHPTVKRTRIAALSVAGIASLMVGLCAPSAHAAPASPVSTKTGIPASSQTEDILTATSAQQQEQGYDRFIINYADQAKNNLDIAGLESGEYSEFVPELYQGIEKSVNSLDELLGIKTTYVRDTAQNDSVVSLSKPLNAQQAKQYMQTLAENPQVDSVEPDLKRQPTGTLPGSDKVDFNDPKMSRLWGFTAIKADYALKHAGDHQVTVAVIDTGVTKHSDLDENVLPGYDFVSDASAARDGNGRDNNPQDEGDWTTEGQCGSGAKATNSTWHGTHVAGTIAAVGNNNIGIAGVAPKAKIVPVRVLGACGGYDSDIIDGMIWASGGSVRGVPANQHPAQVINMSLGGAGKCSRTYNRAIESVNKRGSIIVTSAGNSNQNASAQIPGSCDGVINVGASNPGNSRALYSNYGSTVAVSAPGGDFRQSGVGVLSLVNKGKTVPEKEDYAEYEGTSMAAPHVAGAIAIMRSKYPNLSYEKALDILKSTANPITCDRDYCGAGIIDAAKAMDKVDELVESEKQPSPAPTQPAPSEPAQPVPAPSDSSTPAPAETSKPAPAPTPTPTPAPSKPVRPIAPPPSKPLPTLPPYEEQLPVLPIKPKPSPKPTKPAPVETPKPSPAPVETKKPTPAPSESYKPAPPSWWYWYDYPGQSYYSPSPWYDPWSGYGAWNRWDYGYGSWGGWGYHRGHRGSWHNTSWMYRSGHPWWASYPYGWGNSYRGYGYYNVGYRY